MVGREEPLGWQRVRGMLRFPARPGVTTRTGCNVPLPPDSTSAAREVDNDDAEPSVQLFF